MTICLASYSAGCATGLGDSRLTNLKPAASIGTVKAQLGEPDTNEFIIFHKGIRYECISYAVKNAQSHQLLFADGKLAKIISYPQSDLELLHGGSADPGKPDELWEYALLMLHAGPAPRP